MLPGALILAREPVCWVEVSMVSWPVSAVLATDFELTSCLSCIVGFVMGYWSSALLVVSDFFYLETI